MAIRIDRIVFLIIAMALLEGATAATNYKVGDDFGWRVPPADNASLYEIWARSKKFEAGDSLEFIWNSSFRHNVLNIPAKADYDSCAATNGVPNNTTPVTVPLKENGTYYFTCTVGNHCVSGQKVAIVVGNRNSTSPKSHAALSAVLSTFTIVAAGLISLCSFLLY